LTWFIRLITPTQRIAHPNVITNALICAPDLVVLVKGNSAFESLKFDRQTGEFSISSETAEYSMPCQFSEGIRGLKDECESSNCTILAVTNDRSLLAIIRLERGQTNILKTIPFPVVPSRTGSETPVLIAVDPLNRAFLVAMNGFVQFWLLDANLDVIDTFMLDHSSNLIGNKVIVFAEFMHQSALEPRRKSVMFCLCDKNGQYSAAVVDFSRSDSGKLLMASHDGIMPFPLEIGKPTNLISIPFWQSSCLLITENGCIIIHASDIQANNSTVKQFLFPASTRINFIATMPMDERRDAGSGPRFVASAENGDLIMIEISGESGIEISRIACNVLTGALCGLHFIDPHHFFACTDNAIHVFSIGDKYIVNSTQSLDFPGPLNDFVVFPDGNGDRTISIVGSFGYCSLRRLQNGFGPSSENRYIYCVCFILPSH
jgi:hypothetical protein